MIYGIVTIAATWAVIGFNIGFTISNHLNRKEFDKTVNAIQERTRQFNIKLLEKLAEAYRKNNRLANANERLEAENKRLSKLLKGLEYDGGRKTYKKARFKKSLARKVDKLLFALGGVEE
jgi:seryl-tRNA synthetase